MIAYIQMMAGWSDVNMTILDAVAVFGIFNRQTTGAF
jgi:hypothetical protein